MTERMPREKKTELWRNYSAVWRNVLMQVLGWSEQDANKYIEELKEQMEEDEANWPHTFGFFYDPPFRYLFSPILGDGLHERIMACPADQANPMIIFRQLVAAIIGDRIESAVCKESFDWEAARKRYWAERARIEEWLKSLQ